MLNWLVSGYYSGEGKKLTINGNYDDAITHFTLAIQRNPRDADVYYNRGVAYYYKGIISAALEDWAKALDLNEKLAAAHFNIGLSMFFSADFELALRFFRNAKALGVRESAIMIESINDIYSRFGRNLSLDEKAALLLLNCQDRVSVHRLTLHIPFLNNRSYVASMHQFLRASFPEHKQLIDERIAWLYQAVK